jgi:osmotically-inducible protein OsmY
MRTALKFVAIAAAAVLASGCNALRGNETTSDYADDAALTARVKAALLDDEQVKGTQFNVDVYKGKVTLSGVTESSTQKQRAEQIARQTPGVKAVDSAIRVSDAGTSTKQ